MSLKSNIFFIQIGIFCFISNIQGMEDLSNSNNKVKIITKNNDLGGDLTNNSIINRVITLLLYNHTHPFNIIFSNPSQLTNQTVNPILSSLIEVRNKIKELSKLKEIYSNKVNIKICYDKEFSTSSTKKQTNQAIDNINETLVQGVTRGTPESELKYFNFKFNQLSKFSVATSKKNYLIYCHTTNEENLHQNNKEYLNKETIKKEINSVNCPSNIFFDVLKLVPEDTHVICFRPNGFYFYAKKKDINLQQLGVLFNTYKNSRLNEKDLFAFETDIMLFIDNYNNNKKEAEIQKQKQEKQKQEVQKQELPSQQIRNQKKKAKAKLKKQQAQQEIQQVQKQEIQQIQKQEIQIQQGQKKETFPSLVDFKAELGKENYYKSKFEKYPKKYKFYLLHKDKINNLEENIELHYQEQQDILNKVQENPKLNVEEKETFKKNYLYRPNDINNIDSLINNIIEQRNNNNTQEEQKNNL